MKIIDIIPLGKKNAIKREDLLEKCQFYGIAKSDREMRRIISEERINSVILNGQDGNGYFRPTKDDLSELRHYINQEHDRSIAILRNLKMANNMLADLEHSRFGE